MELSGDAGGAERVGIGLVGFTGDWLVDTAIALRPAAIVSHRLLNMHLDLLLHSLVAAFQAYPHLRSHMASTAWQGHIEIFTRHNWTTSAITPLCLPERA